MCNCQCPKALYFLPCSIQAVDVSLSTEMAFPFAIVEFQEPNGKPSCAVIPTVWLIDIGDITYYDCYWPPFNTASKISKAVDSHQKPGSN